MSKINKEDKLISILLEKIQMLEDEIAYLTTENGLIKTDNVRLEQVVADLKERNK